MGEEEERKDDIMDDLLVFVQVRQARHMGSRSLLLYARSRSPPTIHLLLKHMDCIVRSVWQRRGRIRSEREKQARLCQVDNSDLVRTILLWVNNKVLQSDPRRFSGLKETEGE